MKRILCLIFTIAICAAQTAVNVQKGGAAGANNITADLNIATSRTLGIATGGLLSAAAPALNSSNNLIVFGGGNKYGLGSTTTVFSGVNDYAGGIGYNNGNTAGDVSLGFTMESHFNDVPNSAVRSEWYVAWTGPSRLVNLRPIFGSISWGTGADGKPEGWSTVSFDTKIFNVSTGGIGILSGDFYLDMDHALTADRLMRWQHSTQFGQGTISGSTNTHAFFGTFTNPLDVTTINNKVFAGTNAVAGFKYNNTDDNARVVVDNGSASFGSGLVLKRNGTSIFGIYAGLSSTTNLVFSAADTTIVGTLTSAGKLTLADSIIAQGANSAIGTVQASTISGGNTLSIGTAAGTVIRVKTQTSPTRSEILSTNANDDAYVAIALEGAGIYLGHSARSAGNVIINGSSDGGQKLQVNGTAIITGAVTQSAKTTTYNNIATEGNGLPAIVKNGSITAQTSNATICTYTTPAADGSYEVSAQITVASATAISTSLNVDYTDTTNTARTMILPITGLAGTFLAGGLMVATGEVGS